MAKIVAGLGVPHTPTFPSLIAVDDRTNETANLFRGISERLDKARPDVLVMFDSDHLNTFFLDNLPMISVGVAPSTSGPNDGTPALAPVTLTVPELLGAHVRDSCIESDFDVALTQEFTVDHSILVPLHFLPAATGVPLLPIFINGLVPPLPASARCFELGRAVGAAIAAWPDDLRVAVVASGSFSLDVGGPGVNPDAVFGVPAPQWAAQVHKWMVAGDHEALVHAATRAQLAAAGNVGGELLNWIAMLAAVEAKAPESLDLQPQFGHGFGFWGGAE